MGSFLGAPDAPFQDKCGTLPPPPTPLSKRKKRQFIFILTAVTNHQRCVQVRFVVNVTVDYQLKRYGSNFS